MLLKHVSIVKFSSTSTVNWSLFSIYQTAQITWKREHVSKNLPKNIQIKILYNLSTEKRKINW